MLWAIIPVNSRFGRFISRLGPNKFPFSPLRELTGKGLIRLAVFGAKRHFSGTIAKIRGSAGKIGNSASGIVWFSAIRVDFRIIITTS